MATSTTPQQSSAQDFLGQVFPQTDPSTIKAVLIASKGEVNPAYNAILAITDLKDQSSVPSALHPDVSKDPDVVPNSDLTRSSITNPNIPEKTVTTIQAECVGCATDLAQQGTRWKCLRCDGYEICHDCKLAGVHNEHRLVTVSDDTGLDDAVTGRGCGHENEDPSATRFLCLKHDNENWCADCVESEKACGGPYERLNQTETDHSETSAGEKNASSESQTVPASRRQRLSQRTSKILENVPDEIAKFNKNFSEGGKLRQNLNTIMTSVTGDDGSGVTS